ncbi:hemerythrin [Rhodococcus ruber Chol-4]|uniref:hemerythrin domain-containing protein n=1 Tax=Rhodococcus ruber TaxID=1830 RepID=UPI0003474160|nr:hemerythrin domain-containing protein [Rhodococcus ruber]KXF85698.1 hemerythrin [Rhodococcus ruber Chol-4]
MTTTGSTALTDDDMVVMTLLHAAFRRDVGRLANVAQTYGTETDEVHDALLVGWHGFSRELHHHHRIEDTRIWPLMRRRLADRPDDLAVLDDMEAEHSLIDPTLAALEEAFDDREHGPEQVPHRIDDLVELLRSHLAHEERDAFPLIREVITAPEWHALSTAAVKELSYSEIAQVGPYVVDGATPEQARLVLSELPVPLRLVHRFWWNPRYQRVRRWG